MGTLYDITIAEQDLKTLLEADEIDLQTFNDTMESMGGTVSEKLERCVEFIRSKQAEADMLKSEAKHFTDRAKTAQNEADRTKQYIFGWMKFNEKKEAKAGKFKLSFRKNPAKMVIDDDSLLDDWKEPQPDKLNTMALKEYLKHNEVDGAHLEQGESLQIR